MDRQHPLIAFASRWHACTGDVPPPLVGASITCVQMPFVSWHAGDITNTSSSSAGNDSGSDANRQQTSSSRTTPPRVTTAPKARLYVFGGRLVSTRRMVADMWYLDLDTLVWYKIATPQQRDDPQRKRLPSPRYFHSADVWNDKLIIYGGMGYKPAGLTRSEHLVSESSSAAESGSTKASSQHYDDLCVLDDVLAYDLIKNEWDLDFAPAAPEPEHPGALRPTARYAHLSAVSTDFLVVLGGQNAANAYIEKVDVFHLPSRTWVAQQSFGKQCGSYRSLVASPPSSVSMGHKAPLEDIHSALRITEATQDMAGTGPMQSPAIMSPGSSSSVDTIAFERKGDRSRSDSAASRPSVLSVSATTWPATAPTNAAPVALTGGDGSTTADNTNSASAGLSGLHGHAAHASTANLSVHSQAGSSIMGTSQLESDDGASAGGFDATADDSNNYLYELDRPHVPTYLLPMSQVAASPVQGTTGSRARSTFAGGPEAESPTIGSPLYLYSNYHFTDVKREIEVVSLRTRRPSGATEDDVDLDRSSSRGQDKGEVDIALHFREISSSMRGSMLPPGLRFPTGTVVGEHLIVSGTYLANTSQSFSIWSLHLPTLIWSRIDLGNILSTGSWNRAVVWPGATPSASTIHTQAGGYDKQGHPTDAANNAKGFQLPPKGGSSRVWSQGNKLIILGHRDRDLVNDYNHRQVNCDHVVIVDLESWGIYQPPTPSIGLAADQVSATPGQQSSATASSYATSLATELGLAKLRSSAQGGLVPVSFSQPSDSTGSRDDGKAAHSAARPTSLSKFGMTRLRSNSSATTSSAGSGAGSLRQQRLAPTGGVTPTDNAEPVSSRDESSTLTAQNVSPAEATGSTLPKQATTLPFAPLSFGGRGDFEIICSDGLWLGCDRVVLERRWPWFAERMREFRKRAKRFAGSPTSPAQSSSPSTASGGPNDSSTMQPATSDDGDRTRSNETGGSNAAATAPATESSIADDEPSTTTGKSTGPIGRRAPDPRMTPRQLIFPEPSPVVLAMLEFLYTKNICTALQRHPVVLASLLILGTTYELPELVRWCVHAAHVVISTELSAPSTESRLASRNATPTSTSLSAFAARAKGGLAIDASMYAGSALTAYDPVRNNLSIELRHRYAVMLFEAATLCGAEALQIRSLRTVMGLNKYELGRQQLDQRRKGGANSPVTEAREEMNDGPHGRTRASTTTSGISQYKGALTSQPTTTAQGPYQHLTAETRGSLDEDGDAGPGPASNSVGQRNATSGGVGSSLSALTRPRATTGPSKSEMVPGAANPTQLRNGIMSARSPALPSVPSGSQAPPTSGVSGSAILSAALGAATSRASGGKKRFSLFGRTMGSGSGSGLGSASNPSTTSQNPSPSTSNVDVSALGNAHAGGQDGGGGGGGGGGAEHISEGRLSEEWEMQPSLSSGADFAAGIAAVARQPVNAAPTTRPVAPAGLASAGGAAPASEAGTSSAQGGGGGGGGTAASATAPSHAQARPPRGSSASTRTPRASAGPNANAGVGAGADDEARTGGDMGPGAPPSGLVARLVREREASSGGGGAA